MTTPSGLSRESSDQRRAPEEVLDLAFAKGFGSLAVFLTPKETARLSQADKFIRVELRPDITAYREAIASQGCIPRPASTIGRKRSATSAIEDLDLASPPHKRPNTLAPHWLKDLEHPDVFVRAASRENISSLKQSQAPVNWASVLSRASELLGHDDEGIRGNAALVLSALVGAPGIAEATWVEKLTQLHLLLRDDEPLVRMNAATALVPFAGAQIAGNWDEIVPQVIALSVDPDANVRCKALTALPALGDAFPAHLGALLGCAMAALSDGANTRRAFISLGAMASQWSPEQEAPMAGLVRAGLKADTFEVRGAALALAVRVCLTKSGAALIAEIDFEPLLQDIRAHGEGLPSDRETAELIRLLRLSAQLPPPHREKLLQEVRRLTRPPVELMEVVWASEKKPDPEGDGRWFKETGARGYHRRLQLMWSSS